MRYRREILQVRFRARGFTLAELAVALVIIGLLLASALLPLSTQIEVRNAADTRKLLDDIREALVGFALTQGRLPCPADPAIASGNPTAGIERASCTTTATLTGVVPWATLGMRETDAWGRRFTYRVTSVFADALPAGANTHGCSLAPNPLPTMSSYALCSPGDMTVSTKNASTKATSVIADKVVAIIISHGKNGRGANTSDSGYIVAPVNADELKNTITSIIANATTDFISRDPSSDTVGCSDTTPNVSFCEFDDLVAWIPYTTLISRTVSAGRLP